MISVRRAVDQHKTIAQVVLRVHILMEQRAYLSVQLDSTPIMKQIHVSHVISNVKHVMAHMITIALVAMKIQY